jgi:parvulin-like peptidyl-prolyl isomerase
VRFLLPVLVLLLLAGCGTQASTGPKPTPSPTAASVSPNVTPTPIKVTGGSVAAIVNGHPVPMAQYKTLLDVGQRQFAGRGMTAKQMAKQAMQQAVINEIFRQYAAAHHIQLSKNALNTEISKEEAQAGGAAKFKKGLNQAGITVSEYRALLVPDLLSRQIAQKLYPPNTTPQPAARVEHILIATKPQGKAPRTDAQAKALADKVLAKVKSGGNFATLAKKYSDDTGSATQGGNLGTIFKGETVPPFDHAAFTLPLHKVALVHSVYGYHIMEVLWRGKAVLPATQQQQTQSREFSSWVQRQLKAARVKQLAKVS